MVIGDAARWIDEHAEADMHVLFVPDRCEHEGVALVTASAVAFGAVPLDQQMLVPRGHCELLNVDSRDGGERGSGSEPAARAMTIEGVREFILNRKTHFTT